MPKKGYMAIAFVACALFPAQYALGSIIGFESLPTSNSPHRSFHNATGPVLADDFASIISGNVRGIEWWGAAPQTGASNNDFWEITFHADNFGIPAATAPRGGLSQHTLFANGTDWDGDGIYRYRAQWSPADVFVIANQIYWFSVANASGSTWTWANGAPPTVGSDLYFAAVSTGGPGTPPGPHFGPWSTIFDTNFGFRIIVNPEPGVIALFGIGLAAAAFVCRRKRAA